ncbi:MAG: DNA-binding domain-containing protein [Sphingopyxis sp.]
MLRDAQARIADALRLGPDALPRSLFSGDEHRVMLAMAAHANTISHGRLVALEDSFPATRRALGDAVFNQLSRAYIDAGMGLDGALNDIGDAFPDWLGAQGQGATLVTIARFDCAFLAAHHTHDADAITLADLPEDADALLALRLMHHPAASAHDATPPLLDAIQQPNCSDSAAILITRPDVAVRLSSLSQPAYDAWCALATPVTFAILCANLGMKHDDHAIIPAIIDLVRAGALQQGE